jgi:hypothetical protein
MAELTPSAQMTTDPCCAPEQQATCCKLGTKAECCDPRHGEGCGCAAGTTDIRETVREHHAATVQVASTGMWRSLAWWMAAAHRRSLVRL